MSDDRRNSRRDTRNIGSYILGVTLGEGAFGKVKVGTHIHTGEKVAIKILDKNKMEEDPEDIERVQTEIAILKNMRHKNIIQLYEIMESSKNIYLVMEYCEGKELFDYIVMKKKLTEQEALKFYQEIIDAVDYLHCQNIVHRDLKPENLLLDYKLSLKISDFGLSRTYTNDKLLSTPCGTPSYAPPEMLKGEEYHGLLSDVWSSGVILYAMLCGYLPFSESNEEINCQKIIQGEFEMPDWISEEVADLLKMVLQTDPLDRYDLDQIKAHPWFNSNAPSLRPGIIIGHHKIPIDERILQMVEEYGYNKEKARTSLKNNRFDVMTSIYYLSLRKFIKEGGTSVSDLDSEEYINYYNDENNLVNPPEKEAERIEEKSEEKTINRENKEEATNKDAQVEEKITEIANNEFYHNQANSNECDDPANVKANDSLPQANLSMNNEQDINKTRTEQNTVTEESCERSEKPSEDPTALINKEPENSAVNEDAHQSRPRASTRTQRLSMRMNAKIPIFVHTNLDITPRRDFIKDTLDSFRKDNHIINSVSNNSLISNQKENVLNHFKRKSVAVSDINFEKEKELFLKYNNNPRKSCDIKSNFTNNLLNVLSQTQKKKINESISSIGKSEINDNSFSVNNTDLAKGEVKNGRKSVEAQSERVEKKKKEKKEQNSKSNSQKEKNKPEPNVNKDLKSKTLDQVKIRDNSSKIKNNPLTISNNNLKNVKSIPVVNNIPHKERNKSYNIPKEAVKVDTKLKGNNSNFNGKNKNFNINNKEIMIKRKLKNQTANPTPQSSNASTFRENKFMKITNEKYKNKHYANQLPVKIDTSVERSISKTPNRNLSYSPDLALKPQTKRIEAMPWNLKKKLLDTNQESEKSKILTEYEEFKKNKQDKVMKLKIQVNRLPQKEKRKIRINRKTERMKEAKEEANRELTPIKIRKSNSIQNPQFSGTSKIPSQSAVGVKKNSSLVISNSNSKSIPSGKKNKTEKKENSRNKLNASLPREKCFTPILDFNSSINLINNFAYNQMNTFFSKKYVTQTSSNLVTSTNQYKQLNKKIFVLDDTKQELLKTYTGVVDVNSIVIMDLSKILENFTEVITRRKIIYVKTNPYKFRCSKNGMSFDMEVFKLEDLQETQGLYLKFRMFQGETSNFRKLSRAILNEINI